MRLAAVAAVMQRFHTLMSMPLMTTTIPMVTTERYVTMAKHRLHGEWYSPDTSTVFVTCVGQIICSVRGLIGDVDRDVDTGDVWTERIY